MITRRRAIVAGGFVGVAAVGLFAAVHALIIVPIWWRLAGGVPFALVTGAAVGWAFAELYTGGAPTIRDALGFGALLWLTLVPTTALGIAPRASGFHAAHDSWETTIECAAAFATGSLVAWRLSHRPLATLALAVATLTLMLTMGGPIPVLNGRRPVMLFLAFLPILLVSALLLHLSTRPCSRP